MQSIRLLPLIVTALYLLGCSQQQLTNSNISSPPQAQLAALMDDYWQKSVTQDTFVAGVNHPYIRKAHLPDVSPRALAHQNAIYQGMLKQAQALSDEQLTPQEQTSKAILTYELNNRISQYQWGEHLMPLNSEGGFWLQFGRLSHQLTLTNDNDLNTYLTALAQGHIYIDQQLHWLQLGLAKGVTQPKAVLGHTLASIKSVSDAALYLTPLDHLSKTDKRYQQAQNTINRSLLPALEKLYTFVKDEYLPNARTSIGYHALPAGRDWYINRVHHFATKTITPEDIHQLGLSEIARIKKAMQAIIAEVGFNGEFDEFLGFLRTDPQFYATSEQQLLKEAAYYAKRADGLLPRYFNHLPRRPYSVEPVPAALAPNYTTGRYYSPNDKHSAGQYWVNTYGLDKRPLYELPALTLHEAVPGHHLQIALSQEKPDLPTFRREGYISAFGEGWGLYSEYLGEEAGYYQTPYEQFGRLIYEAWRAARLVVDTGIHWYDWSRQQAMDYMAANTGLSLHNVQTEVDRYITWPGQALSYKLGELTIRELRQQAQQTLGEQFDLREFHDTLLSQGGITLAEMTRLVNTYIAERQTQ